MILVILLFILTLIKYNVTERMTDCCSVPDWELTKKRDCQLEYWQKNRNKDVIRYMKKTYAWTPIQMLEDAVTSHYQQHEFPEQRQFKLIRKKYWLVRKLDNTYQIYMSFYRYSTSETYQTPFGFELNILFRLDKKNNVSIVNTHIHRMIPTSDFL